jgi:hypothetical protein
LKTIYIGALPFKATEELILKLVAPFKPLGPVRVYADWINPTFEPYALVQLELAEEAIKKLDGHQIGSTHLRVHLNLKKGVQNV